MEAEEATGREINNYLIVMKHVCKFCHKRFPCGRSLGGHMRSHLITNPSTQEAIKKEKVNTTIEEKKEKKKKKNQLITPPTTNAAATSAAAGEFSGEANPKKINEDPNQVKCCKECGKAFQSSKALSGHMKSHAVEREKEKEKERQREKENSLLGGDEIEKDPKDQVMDRESDNEGVEAAPKSKCGPRRRTNRRQRYMGATTSAPPTTTTTGTTNSSYNNINGGSSSVSEIDQQQQEDVAMCLIMLSRDMGPWGGVSSEFSDNNSVFLEPKAEDNKGLKVLKCVGESSSSKDLKDQGLVADEILSSGYQRFLEKMKSSELGRNLSSKSVVTQSECANPAMSRKRKAKVESLEIEKRSKFECTTCNKTFHSYQALGGHRASHKKNKGCSPLKPDGYETEEITDVSLPFHNQAKAGTIEGGLKKSVQIISKHECPVCFKEFSSGQALGGHKRSHLMATSAQLQLESNATTIVSVVEKSNATTTVTTTTTTTTTTTSSSHEVRDFLDLNLPAPVEEEHHQQVVGFKPWWVESTNKHEHLVSLISN